MPIIYQFIHGKQHYRRASLQCQQKKGHSAADGNDEVSQTIQFVCSCPYVALGHQRSARRHEAEPIPHRRQAGRSQQQPGMQDDTTATATATAHGRVRAVRHSGTPRPGPLLRSALSTAGAHREVRWGQPSPTPNPSVGPAPRVSHHTPQIRRRRSHGPTVCRAHIWSAAFALVLNRTGERSDG